jgi:hypothetical protein
LIIFSRNQNKKMSLIKSEFLKFYSEENWKLFESIVEKYKVDKFVNRKDLYKIVNFVRSTPYSSFCAGLSMNGFKNKELDLNDLFKLFEFLQKFIDTKQIILWNSILFTL